MPQRMKFMTKILAVDPGSSYSAYCLIDADTYEPLQFEKLNNWELLELIKDSDTLRHRLYPAASAIEWIESYGMAVGREVFTTCRWVGRFEQAIGWADVQLIGRQQVKLHHCHSPKAGDSNVRQALVDRFAPGQNNHGKGTKKEPGWFHDFHSDIWQAYALAVYYADTINGKAT